MANARISRRAFVRSAAFAGMGLPLLLEACAAPAVPPAAPAAANPTARPVAPPTSAAAPTSAVAPTAPAAVASTPLAAPTAAPAPASASGAIRLPTFVPFQGPPPDLPGSERGVEPAYFRFPKDLVQVWKGDPPGKGGDVTAHEAFVSGTPPAVDQNVHWQDINRRLNVNMKITGVPLSDYPAKLATLLAGDDLPDYIWFPLNPPARVPRLPDLARSKLQDLSEYLSGDNIKQFTNLGNVPPLSWKNGVFNGGLYALPAGVNPPFSQLLMARQDLLREAGVEMPKSATEFKAMLQTLTRPNNNRYGLALSPTNIMGMVTGSPFLSMHGVPNNWRVDPGGKFSKDWESEGYKAALAYVQDLWNSKLVHPNSPTYAGQQGQNDFFAGNTVVSQSVLGGMRIQWSQLIAYNPNARITLLPPFGADSSRGSVHLGNGSFGITFLKKNPPDRIKMLLQISDYLAAPFGSEERLPIRWGVKDVHFTFDEQGNPVPTRQGISEIIISWQFQGPVGQVIYEPVATEEFARTVHGWEQAAMAVGIEDPTVGLYSATDSAQGASLRQTMYDGVLDIVLGRRPLGDFDQLVKDWRANGGDTIRGEYEQAYGTTKFI